MEKFHMMRSNLSNSVKNMLMQYIKSMNIKEGTKLPSENEIAQNFSVSRVTIRRALDELEQEGVIIRIHGRGTFVNPEALLMKVNLMPGGEFFKMIKSCGYEARFDITDFRVIGADKKLADILQVPVDEPLYCIEKVYYADNHPTIVSIDRFPCSLITGELTREQCFHMSNFDILRSRGGCIVARDRIEIETMDLDKMATYTAFAKQMTCSSVLTFHGVNYDIDNCPVVFDTEFYDTDYIRFGVLRVKDLYGE